MKSKLGYLEVVGNFSIIDFLVLYFCFYGLSTY